MFPFDEVITNLFDLFYFTAHDNEKFHFGNRCIVILTTYSIQMHESNILIKAKSRANYLAFRGIEDNWTCSSS